MRTFGVELRQRRDAGVSLWTIVAIVAIIAVSVIALTLVAAAVNPERALNKCDAPVAWSKAEGTFHVNAFAGSLSGSITRADVGVQAKQYDSSWGILNLAGSFFGKKGKAWVRGYMTGPGGVVTDSRDSDKVAYDFALIAAQSGSLDGSFRTGQACVPAHGPVTWHFSLITKDDCDNCPEFTLDIQTRTVAA